MKTILVDAVDCFVDETGTIFKEMHKLLETYPNAKIILTNASGDKFAQYGLDKVPYKVFTLMHNPNKTDPKYYQIMLKQLHLDVKTVIYFEHGEAAVKSAASIGIKTYHYNHEQKDLIALKSFLDKNL